jgi:hypothetical protein
MSNIVEESDRSSAGSAARVSAAIGSDAAAEVLKHGPRGALLVAGISVALLFAKLFAVYLLIFMQRSTIG